MANQRIEAALPVHTMSPPVKSQFDAAQRMSSVGNGTRYSDKYGPAK